MGSRFALALARDGQRLRLDVFKGLEAAGRGSGLPSFSAGRSLLAGRSARSHPHDDDNEDDERDNRGGQWIGREQKRKLEKASVVSSEMPVFLPP